MPVVSDSDVIIHASKLDALWLFKKLYGGVLIPEFVRDELFYRRAEQIMTAVSEGVIEVRKTDKHKAENIAAKHGIHLGEAHVKALAEAVRASLVLSNERRVRNAAKKEGFMVAGTIGVVLKTIKDGHIEKSVAERLLRDMKSRNKEFRIHPDILDEALRELNAL